MAKRKLTYEMCHAAGTDTGNRRMRKDNRTIWNREDFNAAAQEQNRLLDILESHEN